MDEEIFMVKNLEFHLKQTAANYDKCATKAVEDFLKGKGDEIKVLLKPCEGIKVNLDELMKRYEQINKTLNEK